LKEWILGTYIEAILAGVDLFACTGLYVAEMSEVSPET
jgi:hypothetical protein